MGATVERREGERERRRILSSFAGEEVLSKVKLDSDAAFACD